MATAAERETVEGAAAVGGLAVRVFRLEGMLSGIGDALAAPSGQTSARWRVLAAVEEEPRTVAEIARAWSFARQSVQRVADLLVADGLAEYAENPEHRRAKLLGLTTGGRGVLRAIQGAQREWAQAVARAVGAPQLSATNAMLDLVIEALGG